MPDKFTATWVSHSSLTDFLESPRLYYLKNVYRNPKTNKKIQIMSPAMALGSAVHEVVESLSVLPTEERFRISLLDRFEEVWKKFQGKRGGFTDPDTEARYRQRGEAMIQRLINEPGPLKQPAVKIKEELPWFWLSEADNIILCGKIDWLEYIPSEDGVRIIDFKTGKNIQSATSLQLPIYHLLVHYCQKRKVTGACYWYLEQDQGIVSTELPPLEQAHQDILTIAKKINTARKLKHFPVGNEVQPPRGLQDYEAILAGKAEYIGEGQYGHELYLIPNRLPDEEDSVIL